jgi:hypothetical protein
MSGLGEPAKGTSDKYQSLALGGESAADSGSTNNLKSVENYSTLHPISRKWANDNQSLIQSQLGKK